MLLIRRNFDEKLVEFEGGSVETSKFQISKGGGPKKLKSSPEFVDFHDSCIHPF